MWRPEKGWERNPCDGCPQKVEDSYGLFCDLACGKHSTYINKEAGADAMLGALRNAGFHITVGQVLEIEGTKMKAKGGRLSIKLEGGRMFLLEEVEGRGKVVLKVTVPGERIMYGTEEGNNNADFILLIK